MATAVYPKYFGLKEPSFSIAPDPHYLYLSGQHREALAHLLYGAGEDGGFVLLTGEVGTGKTTVCRAFLEQLPDGVDLALILNPAMTANELLLNICDEFRIPVPEGERSVKLLVDRLNAYLLEAHARGRRPVLLIDEAQNLRPKVLEQVRLLTNLETTKHKLLHIFLVGQPELRRMLNREGLRQINQRITARFHLRPLGPGETAEYIRHRIAVAGVDRPLFTGSAIRRIHQVSGGVPRLVNILCDRALLGACVTRASQVTPAIVAKAAREVMGERIELPRPPLVRPAFASAAALMLVLVAGWVAHDALRGDPRELIAVALDGGLGLPDGPALAPQPMPARVSRIPPEATGSAEPASALGAEPSPVKVPEPRIAAISPIAAPVAGIAGQPFGGTEADASPEQMPALAQLPRVSLAAAATVERGEATAARYGMSEDAALRVLLRRWGMEVQDLGGGEPCVRVAAFGLRCERERGKLSNVRYFDRPVLLRLADEGGAPRYAVLGALDATHGTLDLESGASEQVPVSVIEALWEGDYAVLWQPPPTGAPMIGPGASADSVRWLRRQIAALPNSGLADTASGDFDIRLTNRVKAFQSAQGLAADGIAGPRTLIALHNAIATDGIPRLMPPPVGSRDGNADASGIADAGNPQGVVDP